MLLLVLQRAPLTAIYWATFLPVRLMMFPYLLVVFATRLPPTIPAWERRVIWCCQVCTCRPHVMFTHPQRGSAAATCSCAAAPPVLTPNHNSRT